MSDSNVNPMKVMDSHAQEEFRHHVRRYLYVFYALLFGTVITVGASYIPFGNHATNIGVALLIACSKAFLVAAFFMHLISERKLVYALVTHTGITVVAMIFLLVYSFADFPPL